MTDIQRTDKQWIAEAIRITYPTGTPTELWRGERLGSVWTAFGFPMGDQFARVQRPELEPHGIYETGQRGVYLALNRNDQRAFTAVYIGQSADGLKDRLWYQRGKASDVIAFSTLHERVSREITEYLEGRLVEIVTQAEVVEVTTKQSRIPQLQPFEQRFAEESLAELLIYLSLPPGGTSIV